MKTILIGYDLNKQGQNYDGLIEEIKSLGLWWHHLDSTWIVKTNQSEVAIRNMLSPLLDNNDELLVVDVTDTSAAWTGFSDRGSQWLTENVWR